MGDRGSIRVIFQGDAIHLYTQWRGSELPDVVRAALSRRQRWDHHEYLARILFCTLVPLDEWGSEMGFGISRYVVVGGDDKVITVDVDDQTVTWMGSTLTFDEYVGPTKGNVIRPNFGAP